MERPAVQEARVAGVIDDGVQSLEEGDVLSVGRESKGVSKMEMRVILP